MSATAFDERVSGWASFLERQESARSNVPIVMARQIVARREGVAAGTLENIVRHRTKGVRAWVAEKIRAGVEREIKSELMRLTHELQMVVQSGVDPRSIEVREIETHLASVRELLAKG